MTEENKQDLTVNEVAANLQVHPRTVQRLITEGDLEAYRFGKRAFRVERSALEAFKQKKIVRRPREGARTTKPKGDLIEV